MIDEDRAPLHPRKRAVIAVDDRAHVIIVADAHHHKIAFARCLARCAGALAAVLLGPLFGFRSRTVVHRDFMPALFQQVTRHWVAHDAQTEERDLRHLSLQGIVRPEERAIYHRAIDSGRSTATMHGRLYSIPVLAQE